MDTLYSWCLAARQILTGEHAVGRVIARPFIGKAGSFQRTSNRRDFSLPPVGKTVFDYLYEHHVPTTAIGKINDIFAGRGIQQHFDAHGNNQVVAAVLEALRTTSCGLIFANLGILTLCGDTAIIHRGTLRLSVNSTRSCLLS